MTNERKLIHIECDNLDFCETWALTDSQFALLEELTDNDLLNGGVRWHEITKSKIKTI